MDCGNFPIALSILFFDDSGGTMLKGKPKKRFKSRRYAYSSLETILYAVPVLPARAQRPIKNASFV